jgi:hypothetical protein
MLNTDPMVLRWRKSSFSEAGNCVEVSVQEKSVLIRDSKYEDSRYGNDRILSVSSSVWREFTHTVKGA